MTLTESAALDDALDAALDAADAAALAASADAVNALVYPCDDLDRGLVADGVCGARPPLHDGGLVLVWGGEVVIEGVDRAVRCGAPLDLESRLDRALRGMLRWELVMPTYVGNLEVR